MCLCRYYGLLGKIVFDNNCIVLPGLFSHAEAVAAVWSGCDLRVLCQQSGTAVSSYQAPPLLSTLGLARVCRPAADIADPEPGTEDGEWRPVAVTITALGTLALGLWDPMSKGFV